MNRKFNVIAAELRNKIESGVYPENFKLPGESDLARELGTSKLTLRRSLDQLAAEALIKKVPYVGTFVCRANRPRIRLALRGKPIFASVIPQLEQALRDLFPEYDLEFSWNEQPPLHAQYDIINITGGTTWGHSQVMHPFAESTLAKFRTPEYYQPAFQVHAIDQIVYALPILYSPSLPICRGGATDSWAELRQLSLAVQKRQHLLWNHYTVERFWTALLFDQCDRSFDLNIPQFIAEIAEHDDIFAPELISHRHEIFWDKTNPVNWCCRQWLRDGEPDHWTLHNWPKSPSGSFLRTPLAGEFMVVCADSPHPDEAEQVAAGFLHPEIQQLIGHNHVGIPVSKIAAWDSLDGQLSSDQLWAPGAQNLLTNRAQEQEFYQRFVLFIEQWSTGKLTLKQLEAQLNYEVEIAKFKEVSKNRQKNYNFT